MVLTSKNIAKIVLSIKSGEFSLRNILDCDNIIKNMIGDFVSEEDGLKNDHTWMQILLERGPNIFSFL